MDYVLLVLELLGGVGLFLYGMSLMGSSLEKLAGGSLEKILEKLTTGKSKRTGQLKGWGLGTGVTAIIQSSAATTLMLIGFVNAGIMKLGQAIPVVFGANVGSTATAIILSLGDVGDNLLILKLVKPKYLACVLLVVGAFIILFSKKKKLKDTAGILVGLGILFTGMTTMESVFSGNAQITAAIEHMFGTISNPLLAFLIGMVLTAIIQSSSASVGILQALSATGVVTYGTAIPIIIGQNIGKCVAIILGGIGANKKAKRVSLSYLLFNIIGAFSFMVIFCVCKEAFGLAIFGETVNRSKIAIIHVGFNLVTSLVLLPFADKVGDLTGKIVGNEEESLMDKELGTLDPMLLKTPTVALKQSKEVMWAMTDAISNNYKIACELIKHFDIKLLDEARKNEDFIDKCESVLSSYILKIDAKQLPGDGKRVVSELLNSVGDLERIGDHCINISFLMEEMNERKAHFSDKGLKEVEVLVDVIESIINTTFQAFKEDDEISVIRVEPMVKIISRLKNMIKDNHISRLENGQCSIEAGITLLDLLTNFERIASHCENIALHITKRVNKELHLDDMHGHMMDKHSEEYKGLYLYYKSQYVDKIEKE